MHESFRCVALMPDERRPARDGVLARPLPGRRWRRVSAPARSRRDDSNGVIERFESSDRVTGVAGGLRQVNGHSVVATPISTTSTRRDLPRTKAALWNRSFTRDDQQLNGEMVAAVRSACPKRPARDW